MNKKGLSEVMNTLLIVLLAIIAIVIVWSVTTPRLFPSQDYKIYKTECINETTVIGKVLANSTNIECNYTSYMSGCMECEKQCIPRETFEASCGSNVSKCLIYENSFTWIYAKEQFMFVNEVWVDKTKTTQECEKKEVEEIHIIDKSNQLYQECVKTFTELRNRYSAYTSKPTEAFVKEDCLEYEFLQISKKDITQDWLDENCECLDPDVVGRDLCNQCDTQYNINCKCTYDCYKYKCGEYEVIKE